MKNTKNQYDKRIIWFTFKQKFYSVFIVEGL